MNIILQPKYVNKNNIYFSEPVENTIMEDSTFIKIYYSNEIMTLNGIFMDMEIKIISKDNYFKKMRYNFDIKQNNTLLQKIYNIENDILNKYNYTKSKKRNIYDSLSNGNMKLFPSIEINANPNIYKCENRFILKISGLWESKREIGLTYKIVIY